MPHVSVTARAKRETWKIEHLRRESKWYVLPPRRIVLGGVLAVAVLLRKLTVGVKNHTVKRNKERSSDAYIATMQFHQELLICE